MKPARLPLHRRYVFHKRVGIDVRRKVWLAAAAIVLDLLLVAGEGYMLEHDLRLAREGEVLDLLTAHMRPPLGAPGTTKTDLVEGTVRLQVKKP